LFRVRVVPQAFVHIDYEPSRFAEHSSATRQAAGRRSHAGRRSTVHGDVVRKPSYTHDEASPLVAPYAEAEATPSSAAAVAHAEGKASR
jgi:hypothetical protein